MRTCTSPPTLQNPGHHTHPSQNTALRGPTTSRDSISASHPVPLLKRLWHGSSKITYLTNEVDTSISKKLYPDISQEVRPERSLILLIMLENGHQLCKEPRYGQVDEAREQDEKDADDLFELLCHDPSQQPSMTDEKLWHSELTTKTCRVRLFEGHK